MELIRSVADLRSAVAAARGLGRRIGFVPTLGALHEGHLSNVRIAAGHADTVVVSIFLNPTQFDREEDLVAYPADLDSDLAALAALGAATPDVVFAPPGAEVYPTPPLTTVHVAQLTDVLEGASRPGHFDAVATVVTKLLNMVQPDVAVFGRKDFQQLQVVRRLVRDLDLPVTIIDGPTVRDPDGLALSSRNLRLSDDQRASALALSRTLAAAVAEVRRDRDQGRHLDAAAIRDVAVRTLADAPSVAADYVAVVDPDTLRPPTGSVAGGGPAPEGGEDRLLVAIAATVGPVRLIDNVEVGDLADEERLLTVAGTGREQEGV